MEAAGLMAFMLGAGLFTTLFLYPGSAVQQALPSDLLRHMGIGACMGVVTFGIVSAIGEKSGAHINPAVTLGLATIGSAEWSDVPAYIAGQFVGAFIGATLVYAAYSNHWGETEDPGLKLACFSTAPSSADIRRVILVRG